MLSLAARSNLNIIWSFEQSKSDMNVVVRQNKEEVLSKKFSRELSNSEAMYILLREMDRCGEKLYKPEKKNWYYTKGGYKKYVF